MLAIEPASVAGGASAAASVETLVEFTLDECEALLVAARESEAATGLSEQGAALGGEARHAALERKIVSTDRAGHAVPRARRRRSFICTPRPELPSHLNAAMRLVARPAGEEREAFRRMWNAIMVHPKDRSICTRAYTHTASRLNSSIGRDVKRVE